MPTRQQLILFFAFTSIFAGIHEQIQVGKFRILTSTHIENGDTIKSFEKEIIEDTVRRTDNVLLFKHGYYSWKIRNDSIITRDSINSFSYFDANGQLIKSKLNEPYNETWDISNSFDTLFQGRSFSFNKIMSNNDTMYHRYVVSNIDTVLNLPFGSLHTTKIDYNYSIHSSYGDSTGESFQIYYEPSIGTVSWRDAAPSVYQMNLLQTNLIPLSSEATISKSSDLTFSVCPNPTMIASTFVIKSKANQNINLNLYDISGKLVKVVWDDKIDKNATIPISFNYLPHGKYIAKLKYGNNNIKAIIISH
jgi:hypothetical protein